MYFNYNRLNEHLIDNYPQMIFVIGLPASGKSIFIKNELSKYFPNVKSSRTLDSDVQLTKKQYDIAIEFANIIYDVETEREFNIIKRIYEQNINDDITMLNREKFKISTTYYWVKNNQNLPIKKFIYNFEKEFFKLDWASNFKERSAAKEDFKNLVKQKLNADVIFNNNDVVIPILGDRISKILDFIDETNNNYIPSIIYLDIPLEESIKRDKFRRRKEGRSVGENIIIEKAPRIEATWQDLRGGSFKRYGIYKLIHMMWIPNNTPFGEYKFRQEYVNRDMIRKYLK